jgi:hypothetical protein
LLQCYGFLDPPLRYFLPNSTTEQEALGSLTLIIIFIISFNNMTYYLCSFSVRLRLMWLYILTLDHSCAVKPEAWYSTSLPSAMLYTVNQTRLPGITLQTSNLGAAQITYVGLIKTSTKQYSLSWQRDLLYIVIGEVVINEPNMYKMEINYCGLICIILSLLNVEGPPIRESLNQCFITNLISYLV